MFFYQRFYNKVYINGLIKKNNLKSVNEVIDYLFQTNENGKRRFDLINPNVRGKQTVLQKINMLWFFVVFFLFFKPVIFILNGRNGIDQKTKTGKLIEKMIGQVRSYNKVFNYKPGWCYYMTRENFTDLLKKNNIKTLYDFESNYCQYGDEQTDFIIEDLTINNEERTILQRFNILWLYPLMLTGLLFVGIYRWFKYDDFGYNQKGIIIGFFKKMTKSA